MKKDRIDGAIGPLLNWYRENARTLPWREEPTPYRVWISEIMLQQTRVQAVLPYFDRFMKELPDIRALAEVEEDRLLRLWEGLGYYSRAKNLKKAAMLLVETYGGSMPDEWDALLALPGIGRYTAGAVLSIAFQKPFPAVDGNVLRIITRLTASKEDIGKESFRREVEELLKNEYTDANARELTQALMELGALVCVPNHPPKCEECPWEKLCLAHQNGEETAFPVKKKAKERHKEKRTILLIRDGERVVLKKRPPKGLLAGLYEFPGEEGELDRQQALSRVEGMGFKPLRIEEAPKAKHIFSHVEWEMTGYLIRIEETEAAPEQILLVDRTEAQNYSIPSAFRKYVEFLRLRGET